MSDERKKPPLRPLPRPVEPFEDLTRRDLSTQLEELLASHRDVLATQRKMALQLDGYGAQVCERFDVFHRELAMLRSTVTLDHAPRLAELQSTLGQKVAKGGGIVAVIMVGLPLVAELVPRWAGVIEQIGALLR